MNIRKISFCMYMSVFCACSSLLFASGDSIKPVTPGASAEAVQLLQYFYSISGKHTLTGQHNEPLFGSLNLAGVEKMTGYYPAVFGQDFGFSAPGTWDGINFRQQIVDEAIRRHHEGFINTIMWHAVRPTEDEPVTIDGSVRGDLTDEEWQALITPGTEINERWKSQVDVIAFFLKQLKNADVPVLWRPYHEMNGDWFWWGKKKGENGYKKLYLMLFDRLVNFHKLHNLVWVYNVNEIREGVDSYDSYYPGDDVVDILATDVYSSGFNEENYNQLLELAGDKPVGLGEVGPVPSPAILQNQPRWTWFMCWGAPSCQWRQYKEFMAVYESEITLTWEELPWVQSEKPKIHYPVLK